MTGLKGGDFLRKIPTFGPEKLEKSQILVPKAPKFFGTAETLENFSIFCETVHIFDFTSGDLEYCDSEKSPLQFTHENSRKVGIFRKV